MARILIVDDDENISALYEEDLKEENYEVAVASNGKESIEMLETFDARPHHHGYQNAGDGRY